MKKLLAIFGATGLMATASTSVIACNTQDYTIPNNPSNETELLKLLTDHTNLLTQAATLYAELVKEGYDSSDESALNDEKWKTNENFQDYIYSMFLYLTIEIKTMQYMVSLTDEGQTQFYSTNETLLKSYNIEDNILPISQEMLDEEVNNITGSFDQASESDFKAFSSKTFKAIKKFITLIKDNKFTTS